MSGKSPFQMAVTPEHPLLAKPSNLSAFVGASLEEVERTLSLELGTYEMFPAYVLGTEERLLDIVEHLRSGLFTLTFCSTVPSDSTTNCYERRTFYSQEGFAVVA